MLTAPQSPRLDGRSPFVHLHAVHPPRTPEPRPVPAEDADKLAFLAGLDVALPFAAFLLGVLVGAALSGGAGRAIAAALVLGGISVLCGLGLGWWNRRAR